MPDQYNSIIYLALLLIIGWFALNWWKKVRAALQDTSPTPAPPPSDSAVIVDEINRTTEQAVARLTDSMDRVAKLLDEVDTRAAQIASAPPPAAKRGKTRKAVETPAQAADDLPARRLEVYARVDRGESPTHIAQALEISRSEVDFLLSLREAVSQVGEMPSMQ